MSFEHYFSEKPNSDIKLFKLKVFLRTHTYQFVTSSGIFSPKKIDKGTLILIENLKLPDEGKVLDLGAGYGVLGIVIADNCPKCKVYLADINERAVWLCKENIKLNNITNAIGVKSDFFEKFQGEKFDLIISNLPYTIGIKKIEKINQSIPDFLSDKGNYQIVVPKQHARVISHLQTIFKSVKVFGKKGYKCILCAN
ncbi:MAG: class I SAM-dependent methyltransferase [Candidatus Lokiarchaeota archaeon]|nr:class I SAM-dependent methyltransferase [Candidatus Lokiarchaeota archaeon]